MKEMKNKLLVLLTAIIVFGFLILSLVIPDMEYSMTERRALAGWPKATNEKLLNGRWMSDFENYTLDQFPFRDSLRNLKAVVSMKLFGMKDNHGLYMHGDYVSKLEYPLDEAKLQKNVDQLAGVYKKYIKDSDCRLYTSLIPDKNYFLAPLGGYPSIDYQLVEDVFCNAFEDGTYIDIFDSLMLSDYYYTDQHWRQDCVTDVALNIGREMGVDVYADYDRELACEDFYGAYASQLALNCVPDSITYLTNEMLDHCTVTSYNTGAAGPAFMYDLEKAKGKDPYELFLSGSDALLVIENPDAVSDKELIVFRDSFGSSLVPLLVPGYAKITVVDLRYINLSLLPKYVTFTDQDVLMLYSTLILTN